VVDDLVAFKAKLAARADYRCENPYCRRAKGPFDVHHAIKRSQGGPDTGENCVFLCRTCHDATEDGRLAIVPAVVEGRQWFTFEDRRPRKTGW
jgi:5-methylcytosine-specific restriction endonuclease McrA